MPISPASFIRLSVTDYDFCCCWLFRKPAGYRVVAVSDIDFCCCWLFRNPGRSRGLLLLLPGSWLLVVRLSGTDYDFVVVVVFHYSFDMYNRTGQEAISAPHMSAYKRPCSKD